MKASIQTAVAMSTMRGLTKVMAAIGDPIGRLETAPDLAEFSAGLRKKSVQKSRIGVLISADYEICAEVLKSPNWRTVAEPGNFLEEIFLGSSSQTKLFQSAVNRNSLFNSFLKNISVLDNKLSQNVFRYKAIRASLKVKIGTSGLSLSVLPIK